MQDCKVDILGTEYRVFYRSEENDVSLKKCDGYTEPYVKKIVINTLENKDEMSDENREAVKKAALRHEIIHAFLHESGLWSSSATVEAWGTNEEITDWIALQTPKMFRAFLQVGALTAADIPCDENIILNLPPIDASVIRSAVMKERE